MPAKDPEKRRATARAWYARNKQRLNVRDRDQRRRTRSARVRQIGPWFQDLKAALACNRCGESHPAVLHFHHADPAEKEIMVSNAVRLGWSRARILAEASKCEVLCANCHAKHHARARAQ